MVLSYFCLLYSFIKFNIHYLRDTIHLPSVHPSQSAVSTDIWGRGQGSTKDTAGAVAMGGGLRHRWRLPVSG